MYKRQLQGLEKEKLQNEYKELEARIAYFNELLSSEEKIRGVLKDELTAIRDRYGDDRVTEIQDCLLYTSVGRAGVWESDQSPLTQLLFVPGLPALFALLGLLAGWRLWKRL